MSVIFFLIVSPITLFTYLQPSVFESSARIRVPNTKKSTKALKGSSVNRTAEDVNAAVEMLRSNTSAEQVITSLGATRLFPELESDTQGERDILRSAINIFTQQLTIQAAVQNSTIRISFRHQQPDISFKVIDTLISRFSRQYEKELQPDTTVQEARLTLLREQAERAERFLTEFLETNKLLLQSRKENFIAQYAEKKFLLATQKEQLKKITEDIKILEQKFSAISGAVESDKESLSAEDAEEYRSSLLELKVYEQELLRKYEEGNPLIDAVRGQINMMKEHLSSSVKNNTAETLQQTDALADQIILAKKAYSRQQEQVDVTQRQLLRLEEKTLHIADKTGSLHELRSAAEKSRAEYEAYLHDLKKEQEELASSNSVSVLDRPVVPLKPIRPNRLRNISQAILIGLACSLLYASLRRKYRRSSPR